MSITLLIYCFIDEPKSVAGVRLLIIVLSDFWFRSCFVAGFVVEFRIPFLLKGAAV